MTGKETILKNMPVIRMTIVPIFSPDNIWKRIGKAYTFTFKVNWMRGFVESTDPKTDGLPIDDLKKAIASGEIFIFKPIYKF